MEVATIGSLFVVALASNALLGIWRSRLPRFSVLWFVAIHASIPVLVGMRLLLTLPTWVIPPEVALAFAGQFVGARLPVLRPSSSLVQATGPEPGA